jgi:hypothetical protein
MIDEVKKKGASLIGKGDGTNFIHAALPHGPGGLLVLNLNWSRKR